MTICYSDDVPVRMIGLALLLLGHVASFGSSPSADVARELHHEVSMSGERFLVPYEHFTSTGMNSLSPSKDASIETDDGDHSFRVGFTSAWLSAHVDGFQPILNDVLESTPVDVFTVREASFVRLVDVELWRALDRAAPERREPNTGLLMAAWPEGVAHPASIGAPVALMETPPRPGRDYPRDPPWRAYVCERGNALMRDASGTGTTSPTRCSFRFHVVYDITFDVSLSGENLSLRSEVGHATSREIMRWMLMAVELPGPREQP